MSRIAKRPICWNSLNASITRGFVGRILTRAASPVFRKSGFSFLGSPVLGSRTATISSNVQAPCAVCAWKTRVYPTVMTDGWFSTTICAVERFWTVGLRGLFDGFFGTARSFNAVTRGGPLYHTSFALGFVMFSPLYELMGMNVFLFTLNPEIFRKLVSSFLSSMIRFSEYSGF